MPNLFTAISAGLVRTALAAVGGGAYLSADETTQIIGAVSVLLMAAWSVYQKVSIRES